MSPADEQDDFGSEQLGESRYLEVRRARYQSLTLYEVDEAELSTLERGSGESLYLNLAVSLLSVGITLAATLLSASFSSQKAWLVFVVVAVVSLTAGGILLVLWLRSRQSVKQCSESIRRRLESASRDEIGGFGGND